MSDDNECPGCFAEFELFIKTRVSRNLIKLYRCPLCKQYHKRVFIVPGIAEPIVQVMKSKHYGGNE